MSMPTGVYLRKQRQIAEQSGVKVCTKCQLSKALNEFWKLKHGILGRHSECVDCFKSRLNSTDARNRARIAKYSWMKRNKDKVKAHARVRLALKSGKLTKEPCAKCGDTNAHAHHHDYNKPLDVTWFCPQHHKEEHYA